MIAGIQLAACSETAHKAALRRMLLTPMKWNALTSALAITLMLASLQGTAHSQDFTTWAKIIGFRPDTPVQEKLQARPPGASGDRWKVMKLERSRGNLFMHSAALVVNKLPAFEGKTMTQQAFFRYLRTHMGELFDPAKASLVLDNPEEKTAWETDGAEGVVIKLTSKLSGAEHAFMTGEVTGDRCVLMTITGSRTATEPLVSGVVQLSVTGATPMEGCMIQIRSAFRPTSAPTNDDEWKVAESFGGVWIDLLEGVRRFVKDHDGASTPELTPPTLANVPWNAVAKTLHVPSVAWAGIEGSWQSMEKEQRFRIEFEGDTACTFIERNKQGQELRIALPVQLGEDPKNGYVIERPNDREDVLEFYDFKPAVRASIMEKKPEPSKLTLKRNSKGHLIGMWYNFTISRDSSGALQELKQPSKTPPRMYEFRPVGE